MVYFWAGGGWGFEIMRNVFVGGCSGDGFFEEEVFGGFDFGEGLASGFFDSVEAFLELGGGEVDEVAFFEAEGDVVAVEGEGFGDDADADGHEFTHGLLEDGPEVGILGHESREEEDAIGDVAGFVAFGVGDALSGAGEDVVVVEDGEVNVVAGFGQHAFDDHVVSGGGADEGLGGVVIVEGVEGFGKQIVKELDVRWGHVVFEGFGFAGDLFEESTEEVDVFGFLPEEGGEVHFLFDPALLGDDVDEGEQVAGDGFFAGLELGGEAHEDFALAVGEGLPVFGVLGEIDVRGVPDAGDFGLFPKAHGEGVAVEASVGGGEGSVVHGVDFSLFASCFNKAGNPLRSIGCPQF